MQLALKSFENLCFCLSLMSFILFGNFHQIPQRFLVCLKVFKLALTFLYWLSWLRFVQGTLIYLKSLSLPNFLKFENIRKRSDLYFSPLDDYFSSECGPSFSWTILISPQWPGFLKAKQVPLLVPSERMYSMGQIPWLRKY